MDDDDRRFDTRSVITGTDSPQDSGDVITPIHVSSTYQIPGLSEEMDLMDLDPDEGEYVYSRISNPTRNALENKLASLEGGGEAFAFASGTAAVFTTIMATVRPGDHIVAFDDLYGGTKKMLQDVVADRLGVAITFVDARDADAVEEAVREETELVFMETPTNPLLKLCDIEAIADIADARGVPLAVDNTFASPCFQRPLELGADVVVASTTKYLNGHSDSVGGAVVLDDGAFAERIRFMQQVGMGNMLSPFDSYQVLRGMKTLPARMERHEENARRVAEWLQERDMVVEVLYPGLESHPQHELAAEQMSGFGGMLSFRIDGGFEEAERFLDALEDIPLAVSLGGVETLIEHPSSMTHAGMTEEEREASGVTHDLLRLSVGIEDPEDLVADLQRGFDALST